MTSGYKNLFKVLNLDKTLCKSWTLRTFFKIRLDPEEYFHHSWQPEYTVVGSQTFTSNKRM